MIPAQSVIKDSASMILCQYSSLMLDLSAEGNSSLVRTFITIISTCLETARSAPSVR